MNGIETEKELRARLNREQYLQQLKGRFPEIDLTQQPPGPPNPPEPPDDRPVA
jgi:hypothetical protein